MIFLKVFYMSCKIRCTNEDKIVDKDTITIVYDRRFSDYECIDLLNQKQLNLTDNFVQIEEKKLFLCDKTFPNLFFISFRLCELKKLNAKVNAVITCYTEKKDILFEFKIQYDLKNITVLKFYDNEKITLDLRKYKNQVYILSNNEKNSNAIKNSLDYLELIKSFYPFFSKLLVIKDICIDYNFDSYLEEKLNLKIFNISCLLEVEKLRKEKVDHLNSCFLLYSILFTPNYLCKTYFFKGFEYHGKKLTQIFINLLNFVKELKNNIKGSKKINLTEKIDLLKWVNKVIYATNLKLKKLEQNNVYMLYEEVKNKIEELDTFVFNVSKKGDISTNVIFDCDVSAVDKFVELYSSLLIEYYDIISSKEAVIFFTNYFLEVKIINNWDANAFGISNDILIANEMKKHLEKYQYDKTDFLIFSQTHYFKHDLAAIIDKILNGLLIELELFMSRQKFSQAQQITDEFAQKNIEFMQRVVDLKMAWDFRKMNFENIETLSFFNILKNLSKMKKEDDNSGNCFKPKVLFKDHDLHNPNASNIDDKTRKIIDQPSTVKCDEPFPIDNADVNLQYFRDDSKKSPVEKKIINRANESNKDVVKHLNSKNKRKRKVDDYKEGKEKTPLDNMNKRCVDHNVKKFEDDKYEIFYDAEVDNSRGNEMKRVFTEKNNASLKDKQEDFGADLTKKSLSVDNKVAVIGENKIPVYETMNELRGNEENDILIDKTGVSVNYDSLNLEDVKNEEVVDDKNESEEDKDDLLVLDYDQNRDKVFIVESKEEMKNDKDNVKDLNDRNKDIVDFMTEDFLNSRKELGNETVNNDFIYEEKLDINCERKIQESVDVEEKRSIKEDPKNEIVIEKTDLENKNLGNCEKNEEVRSKQDYEQYFINSDSETDIDLSERDFFCTTHETFGNEKQVILSDKERERAYGKKSNLLFNRRKKISIHNNESGEYLVYNVEEDEFTEQENYKRTFIYAAGLVSLGCILCCMVYSMTRNNNLRF